MKYIRKFETEAEQDAWRASDEFVTPNVVLTEGVIKYNLQLLGVFIQHINGKLYNGLDWTSGGFSNDEANGIAVITDKARFVIAKNYLGEMAWSSDISNLVDGVFTTTDETTALTDFAGYNNTQSMLATGISDAAYSCANFTFPNGQKGYLPALGELNEAFANESKIESLMIKIGGEPFWVNPAHWSSTQCDHSYAWGLYFASGTTSKEYKTNNYRAVRAFTTLTLQQMLKLILLLLLTSCMKTDIINEVEPQLDTVVMKKPHRPIPPPIEEDTTRIQIGFNPSVEDWKDTEIDY